MTWRDGVHLTGTPIWCDARRRRDVCFVSSADRVGRTGHGQLIATPLTLALLGAAGGGHLGVPLHRRFTLGTVRLELIASGRGPGAAALHVDIAGKTVLYAGPVRSDVAVPAGVAPAEVRACDALVVAAPFGAEHHVFPPLADTIARTLAWTRAQLAAGRRPVLLVDTALDGLEVALCLAAGGIALAGSRAIRETVRRAAELATGDAGLVDARSARDAELRGIPAGDARDREGGPRGPLQLSAPGREPRAILWVERDRPALRRALGDLPHAIASVSGHALGGAHGSDEAFAWPGAAGHRALLAWIESSAAREVFVTGACADAIAARLGPKARVIGPPRQMQLFPAEALP